MYEFFIIYVNVKILMYYFRNFKLIYVCIYIYMFCSYFFYCYNKKLELMYYMEENLFGVYIKGDCL